MTESVNEGIILISYGHSRPLNDQSDIPNRFDTSLHLNLYILRVSPVIDATCSDGYQDSKSWLKCLEVDCICIFLEIVLLIKF